MLPLDRNLIVWYLPSVVLFLTVLLDFVYRNCVNYDPIMELMCDEKMCYVFGCVNGFGDLV